MTRVAIVAGGASGIGAATVRRLVTEGYAVMVGDRNELLGRELCSGLKGTDFRVTDVSSEDSWHDLVRDCQARFGTPDVLVNSAGINHHVSVEEESLADYLRVVQVNQVGTFLGIKTVSGAMSRGSSIVNLASISTFRGLRDSIAYASSKAAVVAMTRVAAHDLATRGIRVNCVSPGLVKTPMVAGGISPALDAATSQALRVPGEMAQPDDIAAVICFLASGESRHVNGSDVLVDGGVTLFGAGAGQ